MKIVSKFGGTSMGSYSAMTKSASLCRDKKSNIVVVSAVSGVTELLILFVEALAYRDQEKAKDLIQDIKERHREIHVKVVSAEKDEEGIHQLYEELEKAIKQPELKYDEKIKDQILSIGERLSSTYFSIILKATLRDRVVNLIDARELIMTDCTYGKAKPQREEIRKIVNQKIIIDHDFVWLTQGFIGRDFIGLTTTLGRGGSDYSAALLAEAIEADELQIWTDVSGIFDCDPQKDLSAKRYEHLTYDEALDLALNGAKVIHPGTIYPTQRAKIPIYISNTFYPEMGGTMIR